LVGEFAKEGALATPENVRPRAALPFDDLPVGNRRSDRERTRLDGDVPFFLGVFGEFRQSRICQGLCDRRDENQLVFDWLSRLSG